MATFLPAAAGAATLQAGPGTPFPSPSAALAAAAPGDTVAIAPGTYYDCAAWHTDRVTVDGGGKAVFSDRMCQDKAAFVVSGTGTVLRGLSFVHARVPDGNGAGIRMDGGTLLVEDCVFEDDQAVLIASTAPGAELVLRRVVVRDVGVPGSGLAAVTVGTIGAMRVEDSRFTAPRGPGGALRAEAPVTVSGTTFEYGAGSEPVLDLSGPSTVDGSTFRLLGARPAAIRATGPSVTVRGSTLGHGDGASALLLQDWTSDGAAVSGNTVAASDTETSRSGSIIRRVKGAAHAGIDAVRHVAGRAWRALH